MPSALRERLAARRAEERADEAVRQETPARPMGYPKGRPNERHGLRPAAPGFGSLLRGYRMRAGLSMEGLARKARFHDHGVVWRIETGGRHPRRETVEAMADALALTTDERAKLVAAAGYLPEGWGARA